MYIESFINILIYSTISNYIKVKKTYLCISNRTCINMKNEINRLKVVFAEKKRSNKWLAGQLGRDQSIVSKWCTNTLQPNLETLVQIAKILDVDTKDLLWSIK